MIESCQEQTYGDSCYFYPLSLKNSVDVLWAEFYGHENVPEASLRVNSIKYRLYEIEA